MPQEFSVAAADARRAVQNDVMAAEVAQHDKFVLRERQKLDQREKILKKREVSSRTVRYNEHMYICACACALYVHEYYVHGHGLCVYMCMCMYNMYMSMYMYMLHGHVHVVAPSFFGVQINGSSEDHALWAFGANHARFVLFTLADRSGCLAICPVDLGDERRSIHVSLSALSSRFSLPSRVFVARTNLFIYTLFFLHRFSTPHPVGTELRGVACPSGLESFSSLLSRQGRSAQLTAMRQLL